SHPRTRSPHSMTATTTLMSCSFFFLYSSSAPRHLHSFPTRRSSDLPRLRPAGRQRDGGHHGRGPAAPGGRERRLTGREAPRLLRSEEHTSELQSLRHLVCRLLLEKKKNATDYTSMSVRTYYRIHTYL